MSHFGQTGHTATHSLFQLPFMSTAVTPLPWVDASPLQVPPNISSGCPEGTLMSIYTPEGRGVL